MQIAPTKPIEFLVMLSFLCVVKSHLREFAVFLHCGKINKRPRRHVRKGTTLQNLVSQYSFWHFFGGSHFFVCRFYGNRKAGVFRSLFRVGVSGFVAGTRKTSYFGAPKSTFRDRCKGSEIRNAVFVAGAALWRWW